MAQEDPTDGPGPGESRRTPEAEPAGGTDRSERVAAWVLHRPLTLAVALAALAALATWAPHYLCWAWWADLDAYAAMAQAWDAGRLPYRDVVAFNFPGQVYLFYALGRLTGWGHTTPVYALDVGMLAALGALLSFWSRRRFGRVLPGLVGYLAFLVYYLSLDYSQVAQRDWHGPFLAVAGLLVMEARPGWAGGALGAALFGAAFAFRPYAVFFLPGAAAAVAAMVPRGRRLAARLSGAWVLWGVAFAVALAVAFAPLWWNGLLDDFVRGVGLARYGGSYGANTARTRLLILLKQLTAGRLLVVVLGLALMGRRADTGGRRLAFTWLVVTACVLLYKPAAPVAFPYHTHPLMLVFAVDLADFVGLVMTSGEMSPSVRLVVVALALAVGVPGVPRYCDPAWSLRGLRALARGGPLSEAPPGSETAYPWADYQKTLAYLRSEVPRETRVANLLHGFPAVCGAAGRLPVFRVEAPGLVWLWVANFNTEADFARALENDPDSVVVWVPGETGPPRPPWLGSDPFDLKEIDATVRRLYEPDARFGRLEVWRRRGGSHAGREDQTGVGAP